MPAVHIVVHSVRVVLNDVHYSHVVRDVHAAMHSVHVLDVYCTETILSLSATRDAGHTYIYVQSSCTDGINSYKRLCN